MKRRFIGATDPRVLICGRTVVADGAVKFDWPGVVIRLAVRGASKVYLRMDGNKNYFAVEQEGRPASSFGTKRRTVKEYLLPVDLNEKETTTSLTVTKRTEAKAEFSLFSSSSVTGVVTLLGVVLESDVDGAELDQPPPFPPRRLEVYGDSDTCAFGNEAKRTGVGILSMLNSFCPNKQDASNSWPLLLGQLLDAQVHLIAWSGIGINWNAPMSSMEPMSVVWDQLLANDGTAGRVAPSDGVGTNGSDGSGADAAWSPDAILIYCGGNDYWTMGDAPPAGTRANPQRSEAAFVDGFTEWLPRAHTVHTAQCALSTPCH